MVNDQGFSMHLRVISNTVSFSDVRESINSKTKGWIEFFFMLNVLETKLAFSL